MGSSMSLRLEAICSQLQKRCHCRKTVASLLKTVADNPLVIACCAEW